MTNAPTPTPDAAPDGLTLDVMAERIKTAMALIDNVFLYRNEAVDALAYAFTGLPPGPARDAALADILARLAGAAPAGEGVPSVVIAISGGLASGKASLAAALAERIGGDHISFGAEVRKIAAEMGEDSSDIDVLQRIGQALVVTDSAGFVDRVLATRDAAKGDRPLVIAGLRHVEVLWELRQRFADVRVVHVDVPDDVRADRLVERESTERRLAARYDNALSEVQTQRILPQYASVIVHGTLPVELQVARIVTCLGLDTACLASTPSPARSDRPEAEGQPLFDRLHIEPLVREWCAGTGSEPHMKPGLVDGLVDVLRKRLNRAALAAAPTPPAGEGVNEAINRACKTIAALLDALPDPAARIFWRQEAAKRFASATGCPELIDSARLTTPATGTDEALRVAVVPSKAAQDVFEERRRQVEVEGWTPEHDDAHDKAELGSAAMCYVQAATCELGHPRSPLRGVPGFWPWDDAWWKPADPRRNLVKAGALILAELERLDRRTALGVSGRED